VLLTEDTVVGASRRQMGAHGRLGVTVDLGDLRRVRFVLDGEGARAERGQRQPVGDVGESFGDGELVGGRDGRQESKPAMPLARSSWLRRSTR
jgi:hypothetical protein